MLLFFKLDLLLNTYLIEETGSVSVSGFLSMSADAFMPQWFLSGQ